LFDCVTYLVNGVNRTVKQLTLLYERSPLAAELFDKRWRITLKYAADIRKRYPKKF
jgi:hypothetical protein